MIQNNITGTIFNIQKFSIHDGIGIRTLVFMKGCPLRCIWCSNPESQSRDMEIMDVKVNCIGCGKCVNVCEKKAISPEKFNIDRDKCVKCGKCVDVCYANAKKRTGREITLQEVMHIVEKDRVFYNNSGGGITIGGGEPTVQAEFVGMLLKKCKESNIHTAIETCGYGNWKEIKSIFDYTDQVFYDLKTMDSTMHKQLTGADNHIILENAMKIAKLGKEIVFRIPLIPQLNDSAENIKQTGEFIKPLYEVNKNISVEILPYHDFGRDKYKWLNKEYALKDNTKSVAKIVNECEKVLKHFDLEVI